VIYLGKSIAKPAAATRPNLSNSAGRECVVACNIEQHGAKLRSMSFAKYGLEAAFGAAP
jgi:hypothetical protein